MRACLICSGIRSCKGMRLRFSAKNTPKIEKISDESERNNERAEVRMVVEHCFMILDKRHRAQPTAIRISAVSARSDLAGETSRGWGYRLFGCDGHYRLNHAEEVAVGVFEVCELAHVRDVHFVERDRAARRFLLCCNTFGMKLHTASCGVLSVVESTTSQQSCAEIFSIIQLS